MNICEYPALGGDTVPWGPDERQHYNRMEDERMQTPEQSQSDVLAVGDHVRYTVETPEGMLERIGVIVLQDGEWFVVDHGPTEWVWVSLKTE